MQVSTLNSYAFSFYRSKIILDRSKNDFLVLYKIASWNLSNSKKQNKNDLHFINWNTFQIIIMNNLIFV